MSSILDRIMARKREEVSLRRSKLSEAHLLKKTTEITAARGFARALMEQNKICKINVIAEVKRASPSKGRIYLGETFDPAFIAFGYAQHGATCLSCLTDRDFFQGEDLYLEQIRQQVDLPVLRKDFLFDPYQVVESRALGADAVLLILAVLSLDQALELESAAMELGMDVLVEVHDERELEAAHHLKTPLMGINNRDLNSFVTTLETTYRLAPRVEKGRLVVSESGILSGDDLKRLAQHGVYSSLVGGRLMQEMDPGLALARLLEGAI
ncbi:MAG: indole-3-glycerol phosphate synthase TrpC [Magnetococcus sp. DMHC-6]